MKIDYTNIGAKIRYYRVQKGMSQEQLAERIQSIAQYIGYVERGEKSPSLKVIIMISNALNVSTDDLLSTNLIINRNEAVDLPYDYLLDCTAEENRIINDAAISLKAILRQYNITK